MTGACVVDFAELAILSYVTAIIYITLCTVDLFGSVVNILPVRLPNHSDSLQRAKIDISVVCI